MILQTSNTSEIPLMSQPTVLTNNPGIILETTVKFKSNHKPWYIIGMENKMLNAFRIATGICAVPTVIINLFIIAFGFGNYP